MGKIVNQNQAFSDKKHFGNKAKGLLKLIKYGYRVPGFFLIDYTLLQAVSEAKTTYSSIVDDWIKENDIDPNSLWAVRSSTGLEDGDNSSFAGIFTTRTNVLLHELADAISSVHKSYQKEDSHYGIIIQRMLLPDYSGVVFSHNPVNPAETNPVINIIPGLGEKLVNGELEGLTIEYKKKKPLYVGTTDSIEGYIYSKNPEAIKKNITEIKADLKPFYKKLITGVRKLAKKEGYPIDVEFCIANGKIYWLQVRPITTNIDEEYVWDNANIGDNYPGLSTPLTISYVKYTYSRAYTSLVRLFGMKNEGVKKNKFLLDNMVGGIQGALYYNVTGWQKLLYQLPFGNKTTHLLPRLLNMEKIDFYKFGKRPSFDSYLSLIINILKAFFLFGKHKRKFEDQVQLTISTFNPDDLESKSYKELINKYRDLDAKLLANWVVPVLNGFYLMLLYSLMQKILKGSRVEHAYPGFINKVLGSEQDVVSTTLINEFRHILDTIFADKDLLQLFRTLPVSELQNELSNNHTQLDQLIKNYINLYGERCEGGELKIEKVNYKENPAGFFELLKLNLMNDLPTGSPKKAPFDFKKVLKDTYKLNWLKRKIIVWILNKTTFFMTNRENYRFLRLKGFHLTRLIFRAMDQKLVKDGYINSEGDSLYLEFNEIMDASLRSAFTVIIDNRKADYLKFKTQERSNRYVQIKDRFNAVVNLKGSINKTIEGKGCCSGEVMEEVVIINAQDPEYLDFTNKIIVTKFLEPGLIGLFASAKGIVCERGNLLSHTAILCRELGIPSIVGAKGITSAVKSGQTITMNGATGVINVIDKEQ